MKIESYGLPLYYESLLNPQVEGRLTNRAWEGAFAVAVGAGLVSSVFLLGAIGGVMYEETERVRQIDTLQQENYQLVNVIAAQLTEGLQSGETVRADIYSGSVQLLDGTNTIENPLILAVTDETVWIGSVDYNNDGLAIVYPVGFDEAGVQFTPNSGSGNQEEIIEAELTGTKSGQIAVVVNGQPLDILVGSITQPGSS